jgi:hypothetical protein
MKAIQDLSRRVVGWKSGDVLYNTQGEVCAFVRKTEVLTFHRRHIGVYEQGLFRNTEGDIVGSIAPASSAPQSRRRRRYQITPWLRFSRPAPRPTMTFRTWAIWDHAIDTLPV